MAATLPKSFSVFLAKDFADELSRELALIGIPVIVNQTFFFVPRDALSYAKRRLSGYRILAGNCGVVQFTSIAKATAAVKNLAKRWVHASFHCHRVGS